MQSSKALSGFVSLYLFSLFPGSSTAILVLRLHSCLLPRWGDGPEAGALHADDFMEKGKNPSYTWYWVIAFSFGVLESVAAACSVETGKQYHNDCANLLLPNFFIFIYIGS